MQYTKELRTAKKAAREAGKYLMKKFRAPHQNKISYKAKREIVTEADIKADKIIGKILKSKFSKYKIRSEELESSMKKSEYLWLVDPLDGTNNFAHGLPIFAVCIALIHKDKLKVGVVYLPYFKEMFWAIKGEGAYLNGKKIKLSNVSKLEDAFILKCFRSDPQNRKKYLSIIKKLNKRVYSARHLGAAGYELTAVARGHVAGGYILGMRAWDAAAGALIVRESGGKATNLKGKEWKLEDKDIVFSNGKIHKELISVINS
ncbi:inositol monophosphatase family protein [Patescibacteria group bacterium]